MTRTGVAMRFWALGVALALLASAPARAASAGDLDAIHVASPAWGWLTEKDGEGLYWELLRAVYQPMGIDLKIHTRPYSRAVDSVLAGKRDAWVASYPHEHAGAVYPEWHMDAEPVYAAYNPKLIPEWRQEASLKGKTVTWVRDYNYQKYLAVPVDVFRQNARQAALKQVARGRVAAFLDARSALEKALDKSPVSDRIELGWVRSIKLLMAYAPNERGKALAAIWDERFPKLLKDGTVADLYDNWDWPDPQWPFDVPSPFDETG